MAVADTVVAVAAAAGAGTTVGITGAVDTEVGERAVQKPAKLTLTPPDFRISCGFRNSPSMSCSKIRPAPI
jgi:hypothetical protein